MDANLLFYLENKMPILAATDVNTDIGRIADDNEFGYWREKKINLSINLI